MAINVRHLHGQKFVKYHSDNVDLHIRKGADSSFILDWSEKSIFFYFFFKEIFFHYLTSADLV